MNKIFDKIFNLISLMAVATMTVPIALMMLNGTFPASSYMLPAITISSTFFGYIIQSMVSKAANKRASKDGFESITEGVLAGFSLKYAGIPITLFFILSILAGFIFNAYMQFLLDNWIIEYHSLVYTIMMVFLVFISAFAGCVIWFYPIERLANIYLLLLSFAIYVIEFALTYLTALPETNSVFILGLAFAVFLVCMLIVFNQNSLQKKYRGSVVSVMTPSARMYNLFLVFMLFVILLAVLSVTYVIASAIYIIARITVYYIAYRMFYGYTAPQTEYRDYYVLDGEEAANMFMKNAVSQDDKILLSYFFVGTLTLAAIIVGLRTGILQKMYKAVRAWIIDFFTTIFIGKDFIKISFDPNSVDEIYNYKDEKKKLQNADIRDFEKMAASTDTYKLFLQRLGRLKTYDEQLCYAYTMLIKIYKKMNINLKLSDTPREVEKKVIHAVSSNEIDRITSDFESVRYAEDEKNDEEASAILNNICNTIKRYLF